MPEIPQNFITVGGARRPQARAAPATTPSLNAGGWVNEGAESNRGAIPVPIPVQLRDLPVPPPQPVQRSVTETIVLAPYPEPGAQQLAPYQAAPAAEIVPAADAAGIDWKALLIALAVLWVLKQMTKGDRNA